MYVGPDSMCLLDAASALGARKNVLDLCAGSGIQGLARLAQGNARRVVAVERESRAVRLAQLNAELNSDILCGHYAGANDYQDHTSFDLILANPPFVAVPKEICYESFAAGGADGERVVLDCIMTAALAASIDGVLALVLEVNGDPLAFAERATTIWRDITGFRPRLALLVDDDDKRADAANVATRRTTNNPNLKDVWLNHLLKQNIRTVRNGLLFMCSNHSPFDDVAASVGGTENLILYVPRLWAPPPRNSETRRAVAQALTYLGIQTSTTAV
eukprot:CAMPEP_0197313056 /NCGR_PEP_ID=MMETSP0891-20130614/25498_1 /TAXON_ID=44058 ORGANISM="Aureoumbra lagunensis, Strain CCMP1510" /NCGR_SAMPLE_ID=MMETSP0891 /ASSEMBLY_ACC=CAM_ASM_000534 /LENGTH=273 /DNA_ID=CAMNT_0042800671 /DNA_START=567 /DNA_END=1388 /DNA_ORIENTATION=+